MSKKLIPKAQKRITNSIGTYHRAMETNVFVFFVNYDESDENGQVKMFRKQNDMLELVSDNYFASVGILEELREGNETWMTPAMKKERKLYVEEVILPLVKEYIELSDKGDLGVRFNELESEIEEFHVALPDIDICAFLKAKFEVN